MVADNNSSEHRHDKKKYNYSFEIDPTEILSIKKLKEHTHFSREDEQFILNLGSSTGIIMIKYEILA